ncbi:MAG: tyrosine-type recombinase/integrase [Methanocellales archaeon]|nr:tyrosine-type recombinase/integrase [Methanocellales archaeon]MDD3292094.1 tyrosine-type recombinase/integrase [Methanocellales archaeon]MDD5235331.1 tyrosine-type recombinase/integrase [Methanocellales archaeon]MDD5485721.1 tyrosine-type recombinase/integrase [Methanocellales archaeon]
MDSFERFCKIRLQLSDLTVIGHIQHIRLFLRSMNNELVETITIQDVENFMHEYLESKSANTYRKMLCTLKVFFRDFLKRPDIIADFKFPKIPIKSKMGLVNKGQLRIFYDALPSLREKAVFLMYATTGLRCSEVLDLSFEDVDFSLRMVMPKNHSGNTKKSWVSFYNKECDAVLKEYLEQRMDRGVKIFSVSKKRIETLFSMTSREVNIRITPQTLREWFCSEMGRLGVPDRYVDAFCGRVPKSVLSRHYTDYSPEVLREIYEKAKLSVLSN